MQHPTSPHYKLGSASKLRTFLHMETLSSMETASGEDSKSGSELTTEAKVLASKKNHKEAEQRRRIRLGAHYDTLRSLLPKSIKTHKASVLAEAIKQVTELKKKATQLTQLHGCCTEDSAFPGDTDEVKVGYCEGDHSGVVKATLCCEDRKELMSDLIRALKTVRGNLVRAEISTIGGRTKSLIWVQVLGRGDDIGDGGGGGGGGGEDVLGSIRRALQVVIDRPIISRLAQGNKRTRVAYNVSSYSPIGGSMEFS